MNQPVQLYVSGNVIHRGNLLSLSGNASDFVWGFSGAQTVLLETRFDCRSLPLTAQLDGEALAPAPNGSGRIGDTCQVGFYVEASTSTGGGASTISFHDNSGQAAFSVSSC